MERCAGLVIEHVDIITMDEQGRSVRDGTIVVDERGRIAALGEAGQVVPPPGPARRIDGRRNGERMVAIPGLIQTHVHTVQALARGLADDVDLLTWTRGRVWPYEAALTPDDVYVSALLSMAEMVKSGTTCFGEAGGQHPDQIGRAAQAVGMRAVLCLSTMDRAEGVPEPLRMTTEEAQDRNLDLVRTWHRRSPRLRASFGVLNNFLCSDRLWQSFSELALRHGTLVHCHMQEIPEEVEFVRSRTGKTPLQHLDSLGVLGPHILAAHAVYVDDRDLELLAIRQVKVSHCPASCLKIIGIAPIPRMLELGITVSIGCDSPPASNRNNVFDEMWLAALIQKGTRGDPTLMPARTVLEMATRGGARALNWQDELGSLEVGKAADIVLLDLSDLATTPVHDLVSALIYQANGRQVDTVIVEGQVLVEAGKLVTVDEGELIREARARARAVRARAGI